MFILTKEKLVLDKFRSLLLIIQVTVYRGISKAIYFTCRIEKLKLIPTAISKPRSAKLLLTCIIHVKVEIWLNLSYGCICLISFETNGDNHHKTKSELQL